MSAKPQAIDPAILAKFKDRRWRLANLYKIEDKQGHEVLFKPNSVQLQVDSNLHTRNLILKSRQHGITTWACLRSLDTALFRANTSCGIVAHTKEDALKFFRNKVLFAYDRLPEFLRSAIPPTRRDMNGELVLANGSRIVVGTSLRSGTYQRVHVSELGPMVAKYPQRAVETISGTLNAVPVDGIVTIESTAEGAYGEFYTMANRAESLDRQIRAGTADLTALDYRFFFLSWWEDPTNVMHEPVFLSAAMQDYFLKIEAETGARLTDAQKWWYAKKSEEQDESMWSQFPSTPDEAFKASTEGSYFGRLIDKAEREGRIGKVPFIPGIPVNTFWDIGRSDSTAIWFHQQVGPWNHFIQYLEHAGEGASYYARELQRIQNEFGYVYGKHYLPHDAEVKDWSNGDNDARADVLEKLGVKPIITVDRIQALHEGIDMVRQALPRCRFDAKLCGELKPGSGRGGLQSLRGYQKEWNERAQDWGSMPRHPHWANHGADAFRQFAQGYKSRTTDAPPPDSRDNRHTGRERARMGSGGVPRWRTA